MPTRGALIDLQPDLDLTPRQAEHIVAAWLGGPVRCSQLRRLSGGLVNTVYELQFDQEPRRAVVKLHSRSGSPLEREAQSLEHLRRMTHCPVPRVYLYDGSGALVSHAVLLLEHIEGECLGHVEPTSDERADLDRQLADVLVDLHGHTATTFGRLYDGERTASWSNHVLARLGQVRAEPTVAQRLAAGVLDVVDAAIARVPDVLDDGGAPTLVHGDVWDGNVIVRREKGRWRLAALLDPDLQYADAELELAYLEVFDHRQDELFAAYTRRRPLRRGYERRRLCYWLHTALVHVALFDGQSFREFTARTADAIVRLPSG